MKKRILSFVICMALCLSLLPGVTLTASADNDTYKDFKIAPCTNEDGDHLCDDCGEHLSSLFVDEDDDHCCDGEDCYYRLTDCADENPHDFKCDICGDWMLPDMEVDVEAGDKQITVTWKALDDVAGVYPGITYTVFTYTDEDDSYKEYTGEPTYDETTGTYTYVITGPTNDVTYSAGVEVTCDDWDGYGISSGAEATPYSADAKAPDAPALRSSRSSGAAWISSKDLHILQIIFVGRQFAAPLAYCS